MSTLTKKINFIDLNAQQQRIRTGIEARINAVLDHGRYIMGPEIGELEQQLAEYVGVKHCVSCGSGTDALLMALLADNVGPGDVVFTTPFTFIATAEVISLLGATPVFVDIDPQTYNIDAAGLADAIEKNRSANGSGQPKGIIPVDLFGQPADYGEINEIAKQNGLRVWEDAAQSFGAEYRGSKACSLAEVACTSFFPAKPLGCYGDGGAIFTNDDAIAEKLRSIRVHGKGSHKYDNVRIGVNGRMDTIQAAVLLEKLTIFEEEVRLRDQVAARYTEKLRGNYVTPLVNADRSSAWAQYSILSDDRAGDMSRLKEHGVPTAIYYPKPLHLQDAFAGLGYKRGDFPVSEDVAGKIFSLPMHPYLNVAEQDYIIAALLK